MDENGLKDLLSKRLHIELQLFRDTVFRQTKEEIYGSSYKIDIFVNIYEILLEEMEQLDEDIVRRLLNQNTCILDSLYQEWLTREDSFFEELTGYVESELKVVAQMEKQPLERQTESKVEMLGIMVKNGSAV